jgi:pumilio family protein 6
MLSGPRRRQSFKAVTREPQEMLMRNCQGLRTAFLSRALQAATCLEKKTIARMKAQTPYKRLLARQLRTKTSTVQLQRLQRPVCEPRKYAQDLSNNDFLGNSSRESHAKQKSLALERKAAKPNADPLARSKKIWERLRLKSHVPVKERKQLVAELFTIITGRVKDFVFKHDSARVIQCAVKYSSPDQKRLIAGELQGEYQVLAESRYAKFLIARLITDNDIRDIIVPEFYGHVKRLIRHPEASWIMDDIYRTVATKEQKALLLREWYGPEFVIFKSTKDSTATADLSTILADSPEKRIPIMQHLKDMTNQLVQKKTTGYTMLHDALLQYFLNTKPGSSEATEFLEMLKDDEEGDCYRNLAFTKSGSRLVCLALAYGNSKDRRTILKFFKTHMKLLAGDVHGHVVFLAAYDLVDDTVMLSKAIFQEFLCKDMEADARNDELFGMAEHLTGRIPLLYLMNEEAEQPKWLLTAEDVKILEEIHEIRTTTSKKDPEVRRIELLRAISPPLLDLIATRAEDLIKSSFECQFVAEVLLGGVGEKTSALQAMAALAIADDEAVQTALKTAHAGRLLKTLVQGGRFDKKSKAVVLVDPPLAFGDMLYDTLNQGVTGSIKAWATSENSWVIVALLESSEFTKRDELIKTLKEACLSPSEGNQGTQIVLEKLAG